MQEFHIHNVFDQGHDARGHTGRVCRTFSQIALILAEREGEKVTPEDIEQICRAAEDKIAEALFSDRPTYERCFRRIADSSLRLRATRKRNSRLVGHKS